MPDSGELLAAKFEAIFPHLDERQRRLLMGAEARVLGHGQRAHELGDGPFGRVVARLSPVARQS
jgi:hypothetical protein